MRFPPLPSIRDCEDLFSYFFRSTSKPITVYESIREVHDILVHPVLKSQVRNRFWLHLRSPLNAVTTILLAYVPNAADGYDSDYDAELMVIGSDALYSKLEARRLGIQGRTFPFNADDSVQLGSSQYADGEYTFSLGCAEGIFAA